MKVGKEEMAGLLAAVEWSLRQDEPALLADYERQVAHVIDRLRDCRASPSPRLPIRGQPAGCRAPTSISAPKGVTRDELLAQRCAGRPDH